MRLYKIDATHHHTEIDVNSPEGFIVINRLFDNSDLNPHQRFSIVRPDNDRNHLFLLSLADESFEDILGSGALKYLLDTFDETSESVRHIRSMVKDIIHDEKLEPWFNEVLSDKNVIITISDRKTCVSIKPRKDDTEKGNDNEIVSNR